MNTCALIVFSCHVVIVSSLLLPLKKQNGQPDMDSLLDHVTLMEQMIGEIQSKVNAADMSSVMVILQSTESELNSVKNELKTVKEQLNTTQSQLSDLKANHKATETELVDINTRQRETEIELSLFKTSLQDKQSELESVNSALQSQTHLEHTDMASVRSILKATDYELSDFKTEMRAAIRYLGNSTMQNKGDVGLAQRLCQTAVSQLKAVNSNIGLVSGNGSYLQSHNVTDLSMFTTDISFQVTLSTNITHIDILKFDTVDYNNGGGYDVSSGLFRAPVSGFYIFWTQVEIMHNETEVKDVMVEISQGQGREAISMDFGNTKDQYRLNAVGVARLSADDVVGFYWILGGTIKNGSRNAGLLLRAT